MENTTNLINPLLKDWTGPYGGVPAFSELSVADFKPALEAAMLARQEEIKTISSNPAQPNFDNTIAALEKSGSLFDRVSRIYSIWSLNMNSKNFHEVEIEMEPKLAAFSDQLFQDKILFERVRSVYEDKKNAVLNSEQRRLTERYYTLFVRAGAKLSDKEKEQVSAINQELATLYTHFSQNLLLEESERFIEINSKEDLAGLPASLIDAAAASAKEKGKADCWIIDNTRSSIDPFLTYSQVRSLREKAWRMFIMRGDNGDAKDNNELLKKILKLRAERARLLGYATHAHWQLDDKMAETPEKAMDLLLAVWKPAVARVHHEVADMQDIADAENAGISIEPWDYHFYSEKVRKAKYDINEDEVKEYLQLDKIRNSMFWVAEAMFGFRFTQVYDVPIYHNEVDVWKVTAHDDTLIGLFYFDPYARAFKRSGAWMNEYRSQEKLDGNVAPIVSNNSNFMKGKPAEPVLISWDDAVTLFHEFGHALHGLASNVTYPLLAGTNVASDFVEFPSQVLERWLYTPEVLQQFALHYKTNRPIPQSLVEKIKNTISFNQGFKTVEYLASALVDMKMHLTGDADIDPKAFEKETLDALGMPAQLVMRHRLPQFSHIFSSDEYSAGYYSYLWADVISADAFETYSEGAGPYDTTINQRLLATVFSIGNTIAPADAYRNFRGRDPKINALMEYRGFME